MPGPVQRAHRGVPADAPVRADRRAQTVDALLPTFTVAAVVLGLLVPANLLLAPPPGSVVTASVAGCVSAGFALARLACSRPRGRALALAHPHEVGLLACLVASLFPLSQLLLDADPLATGGLMVFLLTAGTLLNERRYASVVTAVCLLQWLAAATVHGTLRTSAPVGVVLVCSAALAHVLNAIRCRAADRSAAAESAVALAACSDELTGLANRRGLLDAAAGSPGTARGAGAGPAAVPPTVVFVDVDGLKQVNDAEGHDAGDRLLRAAAAALRAATRPGDVVARLGGDEFALLLPGLPLGVTGAVRRVEQALADAGVPASVGAARGRPGETLEHLLGRADTAMYAVKQSRRALAGGHAVPAPPAGERAPAGPGPVEDGGATVRTDLGDLVRVCAWLHLAVAPAHLVLLPAPAGGTMAGVSLVLAAGFAALRRADRSAALGPAVARHPSALMCLALVVVCAEMVLYAAVVPAPWASLPMVLCLVAAGGALPSHVQVAVVCPATVAVWAVVMAAQGDPVGWVWNLMTLGCALGVAALLHVTHARTMRRLAEAQALVRLAALTDQLTGVANRRSFLASARRASEHARRTGEHLGVLFLDLDGLKQVNDRQGHAAGDRLLALAAATLRDAVGPDGLVARLAGDEFAVLLPGCGPDRLPATVAGLSRALAAAGVAASTGAAHLDGDASVEEVLAAADAAMLHVKQQRRRPQPALPVRQAPAPGGAAPGPQAPGTQAPETQPPVTQPPVTQAPGGAGLRPAAAGPRRGC